MNKIITAGCMAVATFAAVAVPTKTELERAKPVVENMTKADLAAYRAGEKTAQKVAAVHIAYAQKAEGEAAKYLLLQGAFKLYARSGEYDLAAETISIMKREIKDLPPAVIAEIVSDELRYVSDDKAPRLVALLKEAKGEVNAEGKAKVAKTTTTNGRGKVVECKETIGGYIWSYVIKDGGATIESTTKGTNGVLTCAIMPKPDGAIVIPQALGGVRVTGIGQYAFGWCENLKSVVIPPTVKKIENFAFYFCGALETLTIPPSVTHIGGDVFHRCSGLKSIAIPEGVTFIGRDTFMGCSGLETLTIPANVARIDFHAFRECSGLKSLTFLGERPVCGNVIFEACTKLTAIHVPANAKSWAGMKEWLGRPLVFDAKEK